MNFKLGKQSYRHDDRTLAMADFLEAPYVPDHFDFDHDRAKFPVHVWGNDAYGDCVIAGQANCLLRLERVETKRTLKTLTDEVAISRYKRLTGCVSPGDKNDTGLVVLDALSDWRHHGWQLQNTYTIDAYGEIDPMDLAALRAGCFLLGGIHFGLALPITARDQIGKNLPWDVVAGAGGDAAPGSWGGHLVYSKQYSSGKFACLTWGHNQMITDAFIQKYADEAWVVVDSLDHWRKNDHLDVTGMIAKMRSVGVHNIG